MWFHSLSLSTKVSSRCAARSVWAELSDYARARNSTMILRHSHPPLAFYPAILLQPFVDDLPLTTQLRITNLFWTILWIYLVGTLFVLYPKAFSPWFLLVPASASFAMSLVGYNMHIPFGLLISFFFYLWYLSDQDPTNRWLRHGALLTLAGALTCIEYGLFVLFFLTLWFLKQWWQSSQKMAYTKRRLIDVSWLLLYLLILWPAGLLQLNLLRAYLHQAYIALFRLSAEASMFSSFWEMITIKWNASPLELALGLVVVGMMLARWRLLWRHGSGFVSMCVVLSTFYLQLNPVLAHRWYLFPIFATIYLFYLALLPHQFKALERYGQSLGLATGVAVLLFGIAFVAVEQQEATELQQLHTLLEQTPVSEVVVPLSVYACVKPYYPNLALRRVHDQSFATPALQDSLRYWQASRMLIVPREYSIALDTLRRTSTENYWIYYPQ